VSRYEALHVAEGLRHLVRRAQLEAPVELDPALGAGKGPPGPVECEVGAGPPTQPGQLQPPPVSGAGRDRRAIVAAARHPAVPPGPGDRGGGCAQGDACCEGAGARSSSRTLAHRRRSLPTDRQLAVS
jgi:hypothetical protein